MPAAGRAGRKDFMSGRDVYLQRISIADIGVLDTVALEVEELAFAGGTADQIKKRIDDDPAAHQHHLFLIKRMDATIGFVSLREGSARPNWASDGSMTLHNLRIGSPWRGQGFGRAAITHCCQWIIGQRPVIRRLELSVNEANAAAISIYEGCGFSRTGAIHVGPLGRQIIMRCGLTVPRASPG
jgi:ribosomal protein S18 acetylase RimI-like enzyme